MKHPPSIRPGRPPTLREVVSIDNLDSAWDIVRRGSHTAGPDGVTLRAFSKRSATALADLARDLSSDRYRPSPSAQIRIPKSSGGNRCVQIFTVRDRVVAAAILRMLGPYAETFFLAASYGFRPGRSVATAVADVTRALLGGLQWAVRLDIRECFDSLHHGVLRRSLQQRGLETGLIELILDLVQAPAFDGGRLFPRHAGVPQGSALSPLLANWYLHELDRFATSRGCCFVRYADDSLALCRTQPEASATLQLLTAHLDLELRLRVHPKKTGIVHASRLEFLGYRFEPGALSSSSGNARGRLLPNWCRELWSGLRRMAGTKPPPLWTPVPLPPRPRRSIGNEEHHSDASKAAALSPATVPASGPSEDAP